MAPSVTSATAEPYYMQMLRQQSALSGPSQTGAAPGSTPGYLPQTINGTQGFNPFTYNQQQQSAGAANLGASISPTAGFTGMPSGGAAQPGQATYGPGAAGTVYVPPVFNLPGAGQPAPAGQAGQPTSAPVVNDYLSQTLQKSSQVTGAPQPGAEIFSADYYKNRPTSHDGVNAQLKTAENVTLDVRKSINDALSSEYAKASANGFNYSFDEYKNIMTLGDFSTGAKPVNIMALMALAKATAAGSAKAGTGLVGGAKKETGKSNVETAASIYRQAKAEGKTDEQAKALALAKFSDAALQTIGMTRDEFWTKVLAAAGGAPATTNTANANTEPNSPSGTVDTSRGVSALKAGKSIAAAAALYTNEELKAAGLTADTLKQKLTEDAKAQGVTVTV